MRKNSSFSLLALALALLAPGLLAGEVVPASKQFEIAPPIIVDQEYGNAYFDRLAATVTSLGPQGYVVRWVTAADTYYGGPDFTWGRRLLVDGTFAEGINPTTWLDLEDGWSGELSFANLGQGRFVSVAYVSAYYDFDVSFRRFVAGQESPDPESVFWGHESGADPHVASNGAGLFVISWNRFISDDSRQETAQVVDWEGQPVSPQIDISEPIPAPGWQGQDAPWSQPLVGMDAGGNFVVLTAGNGGAWGRRFDRTGRPLGERFRIGGSTPVAMVMAPSGEFIVAWRAPVKPEVMLLSRFTADGRRTGPLVRLSYKGTDPALALDPRSGRVAIFWVDDRRRPALAVFNASLSLLGPVVFDPPASHAEYVPWSGYSGVGVAFGDDGRILTVWVGPRGRGVKDSILGRFWRVR